LVAGFLMYNVREKIVQESMLGMQVSVHIFRACIGGLSHTNTYVRIHCRPELVPVEKETEVIFRLVITVYCLYNYDGSSAYS